MVEVKKGVLVIGFANTVLFGGEQTVELLLLDLNSGRDFSLPISEEQAEHLLEHVAMEDMLDLEFPGELRGTDAESNHEEALEKEGQAVNPATADEPTLAGNEVARAKLEQLLSEKRISEGVSDAWTSSEEAQQL